LLGETDDRFPFVAWALFEGEHPSLGAQRFRLIEVRPHCHDQQWNLAGISEMSAAVPCDFESTGEYERMNLVLWN